MQTSQIIILTADGLTMFGVIGLLSLIAHYYTLNGIKSKTVGDGQHGTARWATKREIKMAENENRLKAMVEDTVNGIKEKIPAVRVNGDTKHCLPGTVNLGFDGVSGESLMHLLDLKGVCVSTSSACTSGKDEPSHVLLALGLNEQQAKSAIRLSYGRYNKIDEVGTVVTAVCDAFAKIIANR